MKAFILALLLYSCSAMAQVQTQFNFTPAGFPEPIILNMDNSADSLYLKSKEWVQYFFRDPEQVLMADIENKTIRLKAAIEMAENTFWTFFVQFDFKDDKVRASFYELEMNMLYLGMPMVQHPNDYFKKNGERRKANSTFVDNTCISFQKFLDNYSGYLKASTITEDW
jgi:hypothetical protein